MLISRTASNFGEIPIGVDVLKRRLQIDDIPENDNELDSLLKEAVEAVEIYTGVAIRNQTVTLVYDGWGYNQVSELEAGPVIAIAGLPDTLSLSVGSFRTLSGYSTGAFTVAVQVGYIQEPDTDVVPEGLIGAVKEYVLQAWNYPGEKNTNWKSKAAAYRRPYKIV